MIVRADSTFVFPDENDRRKGIRLEAFVGEGKQKTDEIFHVLALKEKLSFDTGRYSEGNTVQMAARHLAIPCFDIDVAMFAGDDPYAITRILRDMIASTPVAVAGTRAAAPKRVTLIEQILKTPLLERPTWADPA